MKSCIFWWLQCHQNNLYNNRGPPHHCHNDCMPGGGGPIVEKGFFFHEKKMYKCYLESIILYFSGNICTFLFSHGKNNLFFGNWPPSTRRAIGTAVMRGASIIIQIILVTLQPPFIQEHERGLCYYIDYFGDMIATIHLGAGPRSRPLPLIPYHYYDNLRYHI